MKEIGKHQIGRLKHYASQPGGPEGAGGYVSMYRSTQVAFLLGQLCYPFVFVLNGVSDGMCDGRFRMELSLIHI